MKTKLYRLLELASLLVLFLAQQTVQGQSFTTLYAFTGGADGSGPSGLTLDSAGNLYGLAFRGGDLTCQPVFGCGTVFKLDLTGQLTVLHNFTGSPDGAEPVSSSPLFRDAKGNLYGTTSEGGAPINGGTVFRVDPTGKEKVLHRFTNLAGGLDPVAGVIGDAAGNLYGATELGGDISCNGSGPGCGVVFKLDPRGTQTVLYRFKDSPDGHQPESSLRRDAAGNLYGTAAYGGAQCSYQYGCGTVFKVDATGQESILYTFTGGADGGVPLAGLVRDATGNLYGTAAGFGTYDSGTVFKLDPSGKETVLYSFKGGADGEDPLAGLVRSPDGSLYGTTAYGGNGACSFGCGTVFKLDPHGHEIVLHSFTGGADGAYPNAVLVRDSAGNLYGTAGGGGDPNCGCGTVFKITP